MQSQFYHVLSSADSQLANSQLIVDCSGASPSLLYWGAKLGDTTTADMLNALNIRQEAPSCCAEEAPISLSPMQGTGFLGQSGFRGHRAGLYKAPDCCIETVSQVNPQQLLIVTQDRANSIRFIHQLAMDPHSGIVQATTEVTNTADTELTLDRCDAPSLKVPSTLNQLISFEGCWAGEFQMQRNNRPTGIYSRENICGRTSHHNFPGLIITDQSSTETSGEAYGLHLGWSGNHRISTEILGDGRGTVQMGELLLPGEIILPAGGSYLSPTLYAGYSNTGFNGLSQQFHRYYRSAMRSQRTHNKPRPVHYNSWEAVYFNHQPAQLMQLAEEAANLGAERFILDDGWFRQRHNDSTGLGDWVVDSAVYPQGLHPLIEHCESLDMEFGLWIEPEMVNPDSELFRAHPDWVLGAESNQTILARNQLVLNLSLPDVQSYLLNSIQTLLTDHRISYLKWDMNRDIHQPMDHHGKAMVHQQTHSLYSLLAKIRQQFPALEIESCASGGGRVDLGILQFTDRVWVSDNNDALDRLAIQKGFSMFFPADIMGTHVGAREGHITGRTIDINTRAGVALFGHMGVEADLLALDPAERSCLQSAIALHKRYRPLIHSGDRYRLDTPDYAHSFGIVATDKSQALFSYTLLTRHNSTLPQPIRLAGLELDMMYTINTEWPSDCDPILPQQSRISGAALMNQGIQMPLLKPQMLVIFSLQKTTRDN